MLEPIPIELEPNPTEPVEESEVEDSPEFVPEEPPDKDPKGEDPSVVIPVLLESFPDVMDPTKPDEEAEVEDTPEDISELLESDEEPDVADPTEPDEESEVASVSKDEVPPNVVPVLLELVPKVPPDDISVSAPAEELPEVVSSF